MQRRRFLQSAAASPLAAASGSAAPATLARRVYKGDVKLSIIGFGGIVVCGMEQTSANAIVSEAFERGVNYFDVAPSYFDGEAEMKLIASFIKRVRDNHENEEYLAAMKAEVRNLTDKFPLYPEL